MGAMPVQTLWDLLAKLVTMHGFALATLEHYLPQRGDYGLTLGQPTHKGGDPHPLEVHTALEPYAGFPCIYNSLS
jgi:hypothetical protein